MFILGDIGNTETKICIFNKKFKLIKKKILKTNYLTKLYLSKKLKFIKKYNNQETKIIFSSVVPNCFKEVKSFFKSNLNIKPLEIKEININKFIKVMVNKKQVGSDRLANAISVIDKKHNYIVLDFGTATTFDVIIREKYLGGIIAPGVNLSLETLSNKASLIPKISISKTSNVIGKNTNSAVKSGFYWGYTGLIDNIIKLIIKQTRKSFKVVITGGLAHLFKNKIKKKSIIDKDLTIKGILKLAKNLN